MLQPHRTTHWLIPTLEHALPNNHQATIAHLLRIRAVARNGVRFVQDSGPLPYPLNKILDILLTRLSLVGTKLNLSGVSLT